MEGFLVNSTSDMADLSREQICCKVCTPTIIYVIVGIVPKAKLHDDGANFDMTLLQRSREACTRAGLDRAPKKAFERAPRFTAWGTEVRSEPGRAGAPLGRRLQLFLLTMLVLSSPRISQELVRSLLGSYVHPFSHRKECMSIFSRAYRWCGSLSPRTAVAMPLDIAEEFLTAILHLGLAESDVRAPVSTKVGCPDATPSSAGTVSYRVSQDFAEALHDHSEQRGVYTRLDWSSEHWELHPWDGLELPKILRDGVRCAPWEVDSSFGFRSTLHVNIQEARAVKRVLKDRCAEGLGSERLVNGTGSQVVLGAWAKGRSSSTRLNGVQRASLGWGILGRKRLVQFWLESEENPSDDPSRFKPLRKPETPTPQTEALIRPERIPCSSNVFLDQLYMAACSSVIAHVVGSSH